MVKEEVKWGKIEDKIDEIIRIAHGSEKSKKYLQEQLHEKYPLLRKSHMESFIRDCFVKERRDKDSNVS